MSDNEVQNQRANHEEELSTNMISAVSGTFTSEIVDALWNEGYGQEKQSAQ